MPVESVEEFIGVDFDGTLATYDEFKGVGVYGEPIPKMIARVQRWWMEGKKVKVFTARGNNAKEVVGIKQWCRQHIGIELEVTNVKDQLMVEFWDDRAVSVERNTGRRLTPISNEVE